MLMNSAVGRAGEVGEAGGMRVVGVEVRLLAALLLLGTLTRACYVVKRGALEGKLNRKIEKLAANDKKISIPIYPRGMGLTLAGVKVVVCGAAVAGGRVRLRVVYPHVEVRRVAGVGVGAGAGLGPVTLQVDAYVVPYSVGYPVLTDGDLQPLKHKY